MTNYTKSLLEAAGITSYYTRLYGDSDKRSVVADFVSMQSNHVMLAIPNGNDYIWLECTSQTVPFGFQGNFTDDRDVLVLKPEGGEIIHTQRYDPKNNLTFTKGEYSVSPSGSLSAKLKITSQGIPYDGTYLNERFTEEQKQEHYKNYFDNIQNLKLGKITFANDPENVIFTQNIEFSTQSYASDYNGKMVFILNAFNLDSQTPKRYRNRENPFQVKRGFEDKDEVTIHLPEGYDVEALPQDFSIENKFGVYKTEVVKTNPTTILYKRTFFLKDGLYESKEYDDYRLFREQMNRNDNAKIILIKK